MVDPLNNIHPDDAKLPHAHLQLTVRAENACEAKACRTIADVELGLTSEKLSTATIGKKTHSEIQTAIAEVAALSDNHGRVDWDKVWEQRGIATRRLAMTSRALDRVAPTVREKSLGALHLRKACTGLAVSGISTVGRLIDAARAGIGTLPSFGKKAQEEVIAALIALSKSTAQDGMVDWEQYAAARRFSLLPVDAASSGSAAVLLKNLSTICQKVVLAQFDERAWQIFNRRFLVLEKSRETLNEIGIVYDVSRERIRQIEEKCLNALRKPILEENYNGLEFRFREAMVSLFRDVRNHFKLLGLPAWTESNWLTELAALWQVEEKDVQRYDRLIVEMLGFQWSNDELQTLEPLIMDELMPKQEAGRLLEAVVAIHETLRANCQGLDSFGLVRALKKAGIDYGLEDVPMLVDLCSTAEFVGSDSNLFRTKFQSLQGRANQAVRVLHETGQSLHHKELLRMINCQLPENDRIEKKENLVNQLSSDERLHPIGKSGNWALREWGVETRSMIDIIEDILVSNDEAMDQEEIATKVLEKRPGSTSSIPMILNLNPDRFRKVSRGVYGLAAWGDQAVVGLMSDESISDFIENYIKEKGIEPVKFEDLRRSFQKMAGLSSRSAAGVLARHPGVEVALENGYRRFAIYRKNWRTSPVEHPYKRSGPLQWERIVAVAKQILSETSSGELSLVDVVQRLGMKTEMAGIGKPSLYAAIRQSPDIEKVVIEGSAIKLLRIHNGVGPIFPQVDELQTSEWKAECRRAVAKLTIADVDIGLFMLGRLFDQAMKQLLLAAKNSGLPVSNGHIEKLNNRIEWTFNQGVFNDKPTLNLLRIERNERGHNPPTEDERKAQMTYAPYLAGLYLDYFKMIEKHIDKYKTIKSTF